MNQTNQTTQPTAVVPIELPTDEEFYAAWAGDTHGRHEMGQMNLHTGGRRLPIRPALHFWQVRQD